MLARFCGIIGLLIITCNSTARAQIANPDIKPSDSFRTSDLLFLSPEKQLQYYQSISKLLPTRNIDDAQSSYPLVKSSADFSGFSFKFKDTSRSIDDFMKQTNVVGLIVVRNDSILLEQYREGIKPETKWISFSVTKSVVSLLYGAALQDGYIKSLDQKVSQFIPELKGGVYDSVSLQNLLQMSSGVAWNDDTRDPNSDLLRISKIERQSGWKTALDSIARLKRIAPPGKRFNYNTIETNLAGIALRRVLNKPLSQYLSERIWKPFGMHSDANWVMIRTLDTEIGGCCISATLRDYALLGIFAMKNGKSPGGEQILTPDWMQQSTTPTSSFKGYGYYWWLRPSKGRYFASGAFGQQIEIDPAQNIVVAVQSYWPVAFSDHYINYLDGFIDAMMNKLSIKK